MKSQAFRSRFIFALALIFFIFILYLFLRSFPAEYNIYLRYLERMQTSDPFWTSFWFGSELVGEVGLFFRFFGASAFLAFSWILLTTGKTALSYLKYAVLFEGIYYLFMIPFILSLYLRPNTSIVNLEAGLSYTLQIVFITPAFLILFSKLKRPLAERYELYKWGAIAIVGFTFALWIKHFLLMLYALSFDTSNLISIVGGVNSTVTIFAAGVILTVAFLPIMRKESLSFNRLLVGFSFLLIGIHFIIYIAVSFFIQRYWDFMMLTELWALGFLILGIGYALKSSSNNIQD